MISVSFFHVIIVNNGEKCPRGGVLSRIYRPGGGVLNFFFARGWGIRPSKKIARGFCPGGWSGLELSDTI